MTSYISKLARISLAALVIVPLGLTCNVKIASAKLNIDRNIDRNLPAQNIIAQGKLDRSIAATNNRELSMEYVRKGLAAQQEAGNEMEAMLYYYEAVKIDITNPVAFMAAGNLLGKPEEGINCVKAAALLFQAEGDRAGYELAMEWLAQSGVSE